MAWDIVSKISKMVAKAESTNSLAEAEAIMTKVRAMLDEHGISLLTIQASVKHDDPVDISREIYGYWASDNWMKKLSDAAAYYYGVSCVWTRAGNYTHIHAVGRESCRAAYVAMLPYLRLQVRRIAAEGWRHGKYQSESRARNQIGIALANRLYELHRQNQTRPMTAIESKGQNMLVPVDEVKSVVEACFPDLKIVSSLSRTRPSAQAIRDAAKVSLADQVKNGDIDRRILTKD